VIQLELSDIGYKLVFHSYSPRAGFRGLVAKVARGTPNSRATLAARSPGVPRPSTPLKTTFCPVTAPKRSHKSSLCSRLLPVAMSVSVPSCPWSLITPESVYISRCKLHDLENATNDNLRQYVRVYSELMLEIRHMCCKPSMIHYILSLSNIPFFNIIPNGTKHIHQKKNVI